MNKTLLIIGERAGIGKEVVKLVEHDFSTIICRSKKGTYYYLGSEANLVPSTVMSTIDTVIDCGGINKQSWVYDDPTGELFDKIMTNNTKKFYSIYNDTIHALRKNKGIYISITSITGRRAMSCSSQYCASKAALLAVMRVAAREEDRLRGSYLDNGDNYASIFAVSPIWIPETNMGNYLVTQYMDKRGVSDRKKAEEDFCSGLYNKKPLAVTAVAKFLKHLVVDNRELSRSLMGSDLQIGDQP